MKHMTKAKKYGLGASLVALSSASTTSHAALAATDIDPIVAALTADATLLFSSFLPLLGLVLGFTVAMTLVKRFTRKAV